MIKKGIMKIRSLSFSIKIFFIAGSNNQAIPDVLAATKIENKPAKKSYLRNFLNNLYRVFLRYHLFSLDNFTSN